MYQSCRVCLKEDVENCFFTFSYQFSENSVGELYSILIAPLDLDLDSKKICHECLAQLISFFKYRSQALKNNELITRWEMGQMAEEAGTSYSEVKEEDALSFDTSDDPLEAIHLAKVKMEVPDDDSDDEDETMDSDYQASVANDQLSRMKVPHERTPRQKSGNTSIKEMYFDYLMHGKLLDTEKEIKDLKKRKIICNYCERKFSYTSFRVHCQIKHPNEKKYPVPPNQGDTKNDSGEASIIDIDAFIGPPVIRCEYLGCPAEFRYQTALNTHVRNVHLKIRTFICTHCAKGFYLKTDLREHESTHLEFYNHICEICAEKFKSHRKLARHKAAKHEPPKFKCSFCEKRCDSMKRMKEHENLHQGIRDHACMHCEKTYTSSKHLRTHIRDSHFKSKISCEICNSKLARVENYTNHVKTVHKDLGAESMEALLARIKKITPDYELMQYRFPNS